MQILLTEKDLAELEPTVRKAVISFAVNKLNQQLPNGSFVDQESLVDRMEVDQKVSMEQFLEQRVKSSKLNRQKYQSLLDQIPSLFNSGSGQPEFISIEASIAVLKRLNKMSQFVLAVLSKGPLTREELLNKLSPQGMTASGLNGCIGSTNRAFQKRFHADIFFEQVSDWQLIEYRNREKDEHPSGLEFFEGRTFEQQNKAEEYLEEKVYDLSVNPGSIIIAVKIIAEGYKGSDVGLLTDNGFTVIRAKAVRESGKGLSFVMPISPVLNKKRYVGQNVLTQPTPSNVMLLQSGAVGIFSDSPGVVEVTKTSDIDIIFDRAKLLSKMCEHNVFV